MMMEPAARLRHQQNKLTSHGRLQLSLQQAMHVMPYEKEPVYMPQTMSAISRIAGTRHWMDQAAVLPVGAAAGSRSWAN